MTKTKAIFDPVWIIRILVIRYCPSIWLWVVSPSTLLRTVSLSNGMSNHFEFHNSNFGFYYAR